MQYYYIGFFFFSFNDQLIINIFLVTTYKLTIIIIYNTYTIVFILNFQYYRGVLK